MSPSGGKSACSVAWVASATDEDAPTASKRDVGSGPQLLVRQPEGCLCWAVRCVLAKFPPGEVLATQVHPSLTARMPTITRDTNVTGTSPSAPLDPDVIIPVKLSMINSSGNDRYLATGIAAKADRVASTPGSDSTIASADRH